MNSVLLLTVTTIAFALAFGAALLAWMNERNRSKLLEANGAVLAAQARVEAAAQAQAIADQMVVRATETFQAQDRLARQRLEDQLKPVAETLGKFEAHVSALEKTRATETGGLKEQIAQLMEASQATQAEARKLSSALRRGAGVQGRWGEQALRNVLEAAGMNDRFDFDEQVSVDTEEGRRRPDCTVRLPGGGVFAIDAKVSLNAFLEAQEAADDAAREAALTRHAQSIKSHLQGLSTKAYWDQLKDQTPDFVAMFVPGDGYLAAALDRLPDLMTEGMDKRVIIVTPTTLFALCKAVVYGWRVEEQAKNANHIAEVGRELYKRLADMGVHATRVGKALDSAVTHYNAFVGSLETRVLTQARRFEELGADHEGKQLGEPEPVETAVRTLTKLTAEEDKPSLSVVRGD
ncbi:MAG TPA: DNA recombination protein RmuC [Caulobacteraceae bacterium]|jgi:DNA recombination protein RmuC|nr:DNA recombination protein RmuC [Caulobacteraceae bacterium]